MRGDLSCCSHILDEEEEGCPAKEQSQAGAPEPSLGRRAGSHQQAGESLRREGHLGVQSQQSSPQPRKGPRQLQAGVWVHVARSPRGLGHRLVACLLSFPHQAGREEAQTWTQIFSLPLATWVATG